MKLGRAVGLRSTIFLEKCLIRSIRNPGGRGRIAIRNNKGLLGNNEVEQGGRGPRIG
jgi:hypothetical protein